MSIISYYRIMLYVCECIYNTSFSNANICIYYRLVHDYGAFSYISIARNNSRRRDEGS